MPRQSRYVTPLMHLGEVCSLPHTEVSTPEAAVVEIQAGRRVLIADPLVAIKALTALGVEVFEAKRRVDWAAGLNVFGPETKAEPRDADGDGLVYEGTPYERPAVPRPDSDLFAVYRGKPIRSMAAHVGRPWYGVEDWADVRVDIDRHLETAAAYDALPEWDESAKPAYDAFISELGDQYRLLTETLGFTVEVVDEDPYPDVEALMADMNENRRIKVMATRSTPPGHPYLTDEENDRFRAVHDAFGHAGTGRGFDRHGEEAAYQAHANMFGPLARLALATETRGQNSVLIRSVLQTGIGEFAPQKFALLPEQFTKVTPMPTGSASADVDNAYEESRSHHVSCGRWLGQTDLDAWDARRTTARQPESKAARERDGDGDGFVNDGPNQRPAPPSPELVAFRQRWMGKGADKKNLKALLKDLEAHGWRLREGPHWTAYPPDPSLDFVSLPKTPSDHRAWKNVISKLFRSGFGTEEGRQL